MSIAQHPRVLLMHPILEPGRRALAEACEIVPYPDGASLTERSIRAAGEGCIGIVSQTMDPIGADVLSLPGLRIVTNVGAHYANIDIAAATKRGIVVTHTPDVLTETVADFTVCPMLAAARRLAEADCYTRAGKWKTWEVLLLAGQDLHHATLGLIGVGRIGAAVARRAQGFGMRVIYYDPIRREDLERSLGIESRAFNDVLRDADIISIHVPLSEQTRHLIGRAQFALMKKTAVFVNTSRGPVVDQQALTEALATRVIFAAGIDVFETEPVAPDDPLLKLDNVVVAPHIASASVPTRIRMATLAAENLVAVLQGQRPPTPVNPEVLTR